MGPRQGQPHCVMKTIRQLRPLDDIRDLRPRDHICALYEDAAERDDILLDFVGAGLESGEKVVVIENIASFESLLARFEQKHIQVQQHLMRGQLTFVDLDSRSGEFSSPDRAVAFLRLEEARAMEEGYDVCRFAVHMSHVLCSAAHAGQQSLYMASMDTFYRGGRCMALCLFERSACSGELLLDLLRSHQIVMIGRQLYENFYYLRGGCVGGAGQDEGDRWMQNLVERRQIDLTLKKLSSVVEQTADMVMITDREGVIEYVNPAFEKLTGFSREESIGQKPNMIQSDQHDPSFYDYMWKSILAGRVWRGEIINRKKSGEYYWEEKTITPVRDTRGAITHFVSTGKDVTESRRVAENLRQAKELLEAVFQASPVAILTLDTHTWHVTTWNRASEHLFGWTAAELMGKPLPIVPDDDRENFEKVNRSVAAGTTLTGLEVPCIRKDGTRIQTGLSVAPLCNNEGRVTGALGIMVDLTEKRKLESALAQSRQLESIGRLAGGVAHDFNNLLTVINGYADTLSGEMSDHEDHLKQVREIRKAGERAAALTRQLLAFSRRQLLQPRVVCLNQVVHDIEELLRRLIREDIELRVALHPAMGSARVDPNQFGQVIINLAANARDAMPNGGKLTIETANVELDETYTVRHPEVKSGHYVMLAVSDNGTGMDEHTQEVIFEPFFTTKDGAENVGLGLPMVYGTVKQSGGHIEVFSAPGCGTCFKIFLPRVGERPDPLRTPTATVQLASGHESVLLVEDDATVRRLLRQILHGAGYDVIEATDGFTALDVASRHAEAIPLLVTDITMPGMSGTELARQLSAARPDMKVLCISGYTDEAVVHHGVIDSSMPFLQKPFTPTALLAKVREILDA